MQREWTIVDDAGHDLVKITADTGMRGAAVEFYGVWHGPQLLERYTQLFTEVGLWLTQNADTP